MNFILIRPLPWCQSYNIIWSFHKLSKWNQNSNLSLLNWFSNSGNIVLPTSNMIKVWRTCWLKFAVNTWRTFINVDAVGAFSLDQWYWVTCLAQKIVLVKIDHHWWTLIIDSQGWSQSLDRLTNIDQCWSMLFNLWLTLIKIEGKRSRSVRERYLGMMLLDCYSSLTMMISLKDMNPLLIK